MSNSVRSASACSTMALEVAHPRLGVGRLVELVEHQVVGDRVGRDEPVLLAVLGDVADARVVGLVRVGLGEVEVAEGHLPGHDLAHPGEGLDELALAVALDPGDADDLAGAHLER